MVLFLSEKLIVRGTGVSLDTVERFKLACLDKLAWDAF